MAAYLGKHRFHQHAINVTFPEVTQPVDCVTAFVSTHMYKHCYQTNKSVEACSPSLSLSLWWCFFRIDTCLAQTASEKPPDLNRTLEVKPSPSVTDARRAPPLSSPSYGGLGTRSRTVSAHLLN